MNLYKNTFRFYDLIATDFDNDDLKFYENFLRSKNSKVLEVGCGTGCVSIWLANHGYSVVGLDLSEEMLGVFKKKIEQDKVLQSKIEILHADMSDFSMDRKFDLIITPSKSFQAITDIEKAKSTLNCIKKHMLRESILLLDLFDLKLLEEQNSIIGEKVPIFTKGNLNATYECIEVDIDNNIIYSKMTIKETTMGVDREYIDYQKLRYYTIEQITQLLLDTGFEVVNIYRGYNCHSKNGLIISVRII